MGFADSPATINALAPYGIRVGGYRWRWGLGLKGGTYPPHYHQNNEFAADAGEFEALPGEDVNGSSCNCNLVPVYRAPDGRFAKPGLTPVFQPPPVTAALEPYRPEPLDLTPLYDLLERERNTQVSIPDGAIVVNVPPQRDPVVNMPAFPDFPTFEMQAPVVNVPAPVVNVAAPDVTVNLPATPSEPARTSHIFAGVSGKVAIPKGHQIVSISAGVADKPGSVKIGSSPAITIPVQTAWSDEFDDAPITATSVVFKGTVAYYVRTVT